MQISNSRTYCAAIMALLMAASPALATGEMSASHPTEDKVANLILPVRGDKIPVLVPRPIRFEKRDPASINRSLNAEPRGVVGMISTVYAQALISNLSGGKCQSFSSRCNAVADQIWLIRRTVK